MEIQKRFQCIVSNMDGGVCVCFNGCIRARQMWYFYYLTFKNHMRLHNNNSIHLQTCVCNLVFTTSKGVVNKAAVDPANPPQTSCIDWTLSKNIPCKWFEDTKRKCYDPTTKPAPQKSGNVTHNRQRVYKGSMHKERNKPFVMYWVEHWNFEMTAPTASSFHMCKTA